MQLAINGGFNENIVVKPQKMSWGVVLIVFKMVVLVIFFFVALPRKF